MSFKPRFDTAASINNFNEQSALVELFKCYEVIEDLEAQVSYWHHKSKGLKDASDENKTLREALKWLSDRGNYFKQCSGGNYVDIDEPVQRAREALLNNDAQNDEVCVNSKLNGDSDK